MRRIRFTRLILFTAAGAASMALCSNAIAVPGYTVKNLVSDQQGVAPITDPNLVNPWGISMSGSSPFWVANNHTGTATIYSGDVNGSPLTQSSLVVSMPNTAGITGTVNNSTPDFVIRNGGVTTPAVFLFAAEDGSINAWAPNVPPPPPSTNAQVAQLVPNAIYKGLTLGNAASGNMLYATNFHAGKIDVFNGTFTPTTLAGSFTDPNIPSGFAPFNVQNLGGKLYVTYAQQDAMAHDEVAGPGAGFVSVFDTNGNFLNRLVSQGNLNAPWGLAIAPSNFGQFSNALLVGNFGDGKINAYDPTTGALLGTLSDKNGAALVIDGLWGITFGNGGNGGSTNTLYFAAGPQDEAHGLFGSVSVPEPSVYCAGALLGLLIFLRRRH